VKNVLILAERLGVLQGAYFSVGNRKWEGSQVRGVYELYI
jgi:hypothetical protein